MLRNLSDNQARESLASAMRRKRFALFLSLLARLDRPIRVLDIGGTESYWRMMGLDLGEGIYVTLVNLAEEHITLPNITSIAGDARKLDLENASFDVVFSNSVIEHVGDFSDQQRMAREARRVGRCFFIQTPNKYFPLEPHFLFPLFQFLPLKVRVWLLQNFKLGWFPKTPEPSKASEIVKGIRLLGKGEFISLFPGAALYEEKILGMTKSFVAYGGWDI